MIARVIILIVSFAFAVPFGVAGSKQKPILTDEFDRFLVTPETVIGEEVGKIELIFPSPKKITWSLVQPVP